MRTLQAFEPLIDAARAASRPIRPRQLVTAILEHPRLPFISYPYEWSFAMLKVAALLTLDILEAGLQERWILKDSSPFNVQWRGVDPVFIDSCSIVPWGEGQPWMGYRQFCELFLNPLMLTAYRQVPFNPWLRGSLEGLSSADCARLLGWKTLFRAGVFKHVFLHNVLQRHAEQRVTHHDLQRTGVNADILCSDIRNLRGVIASLAARAPASHWVSYSLERNYSAPEYAEKLAIVRRWIKT